MKNSLLSYKSKDLIVKVTLSYFIIFSSFLCKAQAKYPIELNIAGVGMLSITNDIVLNDTFKIQYSENTRLKFVIFDPMGKSYFEVFKNNKLFAKGYFENSLDTLKDYTAAIPINGQPTKIEVLKYFKPLKNGKWVESINGKYVTRKYNMGVIE